MNATSRIPSARIPIPGATPIFSGKVRDIYELGGDRLLLVASDDLSAFDVVLPTRIPGKGQVLTRVSAWWFRNLKAAAPHHLISTDARDLPEPFRNFATELADRFMIVRRARRIDFECVVRARLTGSGYKDYMKTGGVCGISLPAGLDDGALLDHPVFTPATKNDSGHDENLGWDELVKSLSSPLAEALRARSLAIFNEAAQACRAREVELVDTKFEFGLVDGELTLVDEILSPDSSRFWRRDGGPIRNVMDKQYVRDYLETLPWDKTAPGPELPQEMIQRVAEMYRDAERRLIGS